MPQISEITDAMNAPMDESNTSNSYQISASTPEQVQTHSIELCMFGNPTQRVRILEVAAQVQVDHQCRRVHHHIGGREH